MSARSLVVSVVAVLASVAAWGVLAAPAALAGESCANEARRVEQGSAYLPDCRAYELLTPTGSPPIAFRFGEAGLPPLELTGFGATGRQPYNLPPSQVKAWPAVDGDAALYQSYESSSQSDEQGSNLVRRGPGGWTWENIAPLQSRHAGLCGVANWVGASRNLEQVAFADGDTEVQSGGFPKAPEECGHEEPYLFSEAEGESREAANLFLRDTASGSFRLVNVTPLGVQSHDPFFDAISADGSHVVFQSRAQLTPDAPPPSERTFCPEGEGWNEIGDVYVFGAGAVRLLTVLPEGKAVLGTLAGAHPSECHEVPSQSTRFTHSVSADGQRILFYHGGSFAGPATKPAIDASYRGGGLYLREHPNAEESTAGECNKVEQEAEPEKACTLQIDLPNKGVSGSGRNGQFQWAVETPRIVEGKETSEMARIFFTDEEKLTADATASAGEPDLYEYDLEKKEGERLTDLTVNTATEPADVLGVAGASEDGSYVYFVAQGDLTGDQENSHGATAAKATAGEANLYVRHYDSTTEGWEVPVFIATLNAEGGDRCDWTAMCLTSRVSANGAYIGFDSIKELTGYDNQPESEHAEACEPLTLVAGSPCMETYRYAAPTPGSADGELTCASCDPEGKPPAAELAWSVIESAGHFNPAGLPHGGANMQLAPNVSDSGQVFFDTMEALVKTDENKTWDVYEYSGGEGTSAQLHLISSGESAEPSYFFNATPDGGNVFFITAQSLLRGDIRADYDLYDARVGGGFAAQNEPVQPPACKGEGDCRSPLSEPPAEFSVASAALFGPGNLAVAPAPPVVNKPAKKMPKKATKCLKGKKLSHGKCVKKKPKKSKTKRSTRRRGSK